MAGKHTINISVLADTKKFSSAMRNLGKETGLSKLGDMARGAGKKIVGFFKSGIKWAGAFAAATLATALFKGWNRLTSIENAKKQLDTLGYTGEQVDGIMGDVLDSVKGTAFGLDEAAGLANAALAAGIAPGEDLAKELGFVADAAAFANIDLGRMGAIMGKSAGGMKITMGQLNQLRDAGLPALSMLADAYDVTAAEMESMVSRGEVSGDDMRRVLGETIGGAATGMGDTTQGAFANMGAALGRFGAVLLDKVFPMFKDAFNGITDFLDNLTEKAEPIGEVVGSAFKRAVAAVQDLAAWFRKDLLPVLKEVWEIVKGAFLDAWEQVSAALEEAGFSAKGAGDGMKQGIIDALRMLAPIIATVITGIATMVVWFIENRETIIPLVAAIGSMIVAGMAIMKIVAVFKALAVVIALVTSPVGLVVAAIGLLVLAFVHLWNTSEAFRDFWKRVWTNIKIAANGVVNWFKSVPAWFKTQFDRIRNFGNAFRATWSAVWNAAKNLVSNIWNGIRTAIQNGINRVRSILNTIGDFIRSFLRNPVSTMGNLMDGLANTMSRAASNIWRLVRAAFRTGVNEAVGFVRDLPRRAREALSNAGSALSGAGRRIIDGFIDGIRAGFDRVRNTLSGLTDLLPSWKGPPKRDRSLLAGAGHLIIQGFIDSMESEYGAVKRSLTGLTRDIGRTDMGTIDGPAFVPGAYANRFAAASGAGGHAHGRNVTIEVHALMDGPEVGRRVHKALADYDRMNGVRA